VPVRTWEARCKEAPTMRAELLLAWFYCLAGALPWKQPTSAVQPVPPRCRQMRLKPRPLVLHVKPAMDGSPLTTPAPQRRHACCHRRSRGLCRYARFAARYSLPSPAGRGLSDRLPHEQKQQALGLPGGHALRRCALSLAVHAECTQPSTCGVRAGKLQVRFCSRSTCVMHVAR